MSAKVRAIIATRGLYESGLSAQLTHRKIPFVDFNRDELIKTKLKANYSETVIRSTSIERTVDREVCRTRWNAARRDFFALRRGGVTTTSANVSQRVYRGDLDTPKTPKSIRLAALSGGLARDLEAWLKSTPNTGPAGWLFPSEKMDKPIWKDGIWRRHIRPKLVEQGLDWVKFQVLRRTHSSLMRDKDIDPTVVADQLRHTLDVNLNVYTQTSLERRIEAVETLEAALVN